MLITRLLLAPAACAVVIRFVMAPWLTETAASVGLLIACMPVAITCGTFIERFGGERELGAQSITLSTALSLVSVPVVYALLKSLL